MKLGYVLIYVADVKAVMAFYQTAFGLQEKMQYEENGHVDYGELFTGGSVLGFASHGLGQMNLKGEYQPVSATGQPVGIELAFVCDDVASDYQKAVDAGAVSVAAPLEKPWGQTVAYVRSVEGTLIELCSPIQTNE